MHTHGDITVHTRCCCWVHSLWYAATHTARVASLHSQHTAPRTNTPPRPRPAVGVRSANSICCGVRSATVPEAQCPTYSYLTAVVSAPPQYLADALHHTTLRVSSVHLTLLLCRSSPRVHTLLQLSCYLRVHMLLSSHTRALVHTARARYSCVQLRYSCDAEHAHYEYTVCCPVVACGPAQESNPS